LEQILVELNDDMTLGTLRQLARSLGRQLVISLEGGRVSEPTAAAKPGGKRGRRRRKLSRAARAALAKNLVKARAARAANQAAAARRARR
jgi:hypothetical protein